MSEQDRGAYTPQNDAPLSFDPRKTRGGGGGPAPMTLLVSAIILMALVVGLLIFYRHGMRHPGQAPQIVGAPVGQTKAPPPSGASGEPDQAAGLQVYKSEATPPSETRSPDFEAPPEQPAPLPPPRPQVAPPAVISQAPLRGVAGAPVAHPASRPPEARAPETRAPEPRPAPPARAVPARPAPVDAGNVAGSAFASHAAHPAATPAKPEAAARPALAPEAKPARPRAAEPADELASTPHGAGGGALVQIGAFSSTALAQKGWSDVAQVMPGRMSGKTRKVEMTSKGGKTFYRAYVGGFGSHADAVAFCEALRAKGKACFVK